MCTVTVVPLGDGFSLAFNRDERRDRPAAIGPAIRRLDRRVAVFPIDPAGGGTWIGVNDAGLVAALLNRTITPDLPVFPRPSRGLIVPLVLERAALADAIHAAHALDVSRFGLFRLLLLKQRRGVVLTSDGNGLVVEPVDAARPFMLTSSSLGDDVVEGPRRRLFDLLFTSDLTRERDVQRHFHSHRWRDRPEVSVLMERSDARTVSQSFISVSASATRFQYRPLPPAAAGPLAA